MLTYASAQAMAPTKQPKKQKRQRQMTLFGSADDSTVVNGGSMHMRSEQIDVGNVADRPTTPLAGPVRSKSEATRLSPFLPSL